ncbi:24600_t:CDS:2, partial [Gigaspora margarita]
MKDTGFWNKDTKPQLLGENTRSQLLDKDTKPQLLSEDTKPQLLDLSTVMQNNTIVTPPDIPLLAKNTNKAGLARHNTIIRKYSIQEKLPVVPANLLDLFKNNLVYFIHHQLSNGFKKARKKTVSITCEQKLNQIFGRTDWGETLATAKRFGSSTLKSKKKFNKYKYGEVIVEWKCKYDKDAS